MLLRLFAATALAMWISFAALMGYPRTVAPTVHACSIGTIVLEQAVRDSDAAAIVEVLSTGRSENNAPRVTVTPSGEGVPGSPRIEPRPATAQPFDLTGYGALLRITQVLFGDLPNEVQVDVASRQQMERDRRLEEAGLRPICPLGLANARYVAGWFYVVLMKKSDTGWSTYLTFNYRLDGNNVVTMRELPEELRPWGSPWEIESRREVYERFFLGLGQRVYPEATRPDVPPDEEVWRITASRVPLQSFADAMRSARSQPIHPPRTGDGGLVPETLR